MEEGPGALRNNLRAGDLAFSPPTLTFLFPLLFPDTLCRKPSQGGHLQKMAGSQGRREDHLCGAPGDPALPLALNRNLQTQGPDTAPGPTGSGLGHFLYWNLASLRGKWVA